ncbi:ABC transporter permease subunit [bacterium]|nr:ABC transporter permease subunit [bacterium]
MNLKTTYSLYKGELLPQSSTQLSTTKTSGSRGIRRRIRRHKQLYLIVLIPMVFVFVFQYMPMYGLQIAFKDYWILKGFWDSPWTGFKHFKMFINSYYFGRLLSNTIGLSVYQIVAGILPPIIIAIALNESRNMIFKKTVQMVVFAPYFLSTVIITSILMQLLSYQGLVNQIFEVFGLKPTLFLGKPELFKSLFVWSGVWQHAGYGAVIYLAALAGINPELYEAARVDGVSKWQQIRHIDIPGLLPTIIILLILRSGSVLNVGFEKVLLLQNPLNLRASDVIDTYVYRMGLINFEYSFSTAVGLFKSVANLILLISVNSIAKKVGETSLW